jgi:hypothetical protein
MDISSQLHAPAALPLGRNHSTVTHQTGGSVGPKAGLDCFGGEIISCPYYNSNPRLSSLNVYLTFDRSSISVKITLLILAPVKDPFTAHIFFKKL